MNKFVVRQSLVLLLAAVIWGVAFVAQSVGMEYVGPFTFNAVRSTIGGLTLLVYLSVRGLVRKRVSAACGQKKAGLSAESQHPGCIAEGIQPPRERENENSRRNLLLAGTICGILLCVASNFQQFGIQYTTVGKSGFITAMYIVIVPLLGLFIGKKAGIKIWCAVALAVAGLYFLCMGGGVTALQKGDILTLFCAITFSFHILTVDHFAAKVDGVKLSCMQFFVCGILSGIGMLVFEHPQFAQIIAAWLPILYAGVLSCGVAYTLQIVGQRGMNPTVASLLLSMESVVSVIAGWVILHQQLSIRELSGCVLMLAAIILVQIPGVKSCSVCDLKEDEYR